MMDLGKRASKQLLLADLKYLLASSAVQYCTRLNPLVS